jgi:site-specific recombinase XerD
MSPRFQKKPPRKIVSSQLADPYLDFILSRRAKQCTPVTVLHYENTVRKFILWAEARGVQNCGDITAFMVRQYLAEMTDRGMSDRTCHGHARGIKTFLRFCYRERYIREEVSFDMPKLSKKRLPVLNADQLRQIVAECDVRDRAIVQLMADTGLRNTEVCSLNWGDINFENGLIRIKQGKGQKDRSVVAGATSRRALLSYRRTLKRQADDSPLFQSNYNYLNQRLTRTGLLLIYRRLSQKTNIHVTPHAMRRTFVILSLRRNMDVGHIQAMLGHSDLTMVYHYAQLEDEDLIQAHARSGPVDDLF